MFIIGLILDFIVGFVIRRLFQRLWVTIIVILMLTFVGTLVLIIYGFMLVGLSESNTVEAAENSINALFDMGLAFGGGSLLGGTAGTGIGSIGRNNKMIG